MAAPQPLFGTDGIRGQVSAWPLCADFLVHLGQTVAEVVREAGHAPLALVGRDTRRSGPCIEAALTAGLMERGLDVVLLGVMPTPAVAFLTRRFGAGLGVVISASHNPAADNGVKFFAGTGFKLPDEMEREIELRVQQARAPSAGSPAAVGRPVAAQVSPEATYLEELLGRAGRPNLLQNWKIVLDCAHGATYRLAPELFRRLGARVTALGAQPDGDNINRDCGSEHPQALREAVLQERADAGLAFDGDGDRLLIVDERGSCLDGDYILGILARDLFSREQLRNSTVVGTVMSNLGLERTLESMGARLERVAVGDRHIIRRMLAGDYVLGGEPSGHIVLLGEGSTTGDGLYTAIRVLNIAVRARRKLSHLTVGLRRYPQVIVNVPVADRVPLEDIVEVRQAGALVRERLGGKVRTLLRYSGTQPLLRVMVEGEDEAQVRWAAGVLAAGVRQGLGGADDTASR